MYPDDDPSQRIDYLSESRQSETAVYVAECDLGLGVFAVRDLAPGEIAFSFDGPIISYAETIAKGSRESDPLQIGHDRYIDPSPPGRFINHSCLPNAGVIQDRIVIALCAICAGEELRFDYSTTMNGDGWTMDCRCGASTCRGVVRAFEHLPSDVRQRYLRLGIVQSFIRRQLSA